MSHNQVPARDTVACPRCNLRQYVAEYCRRCHHALGVSYLEILLPDSRTLRQVDDRRSLYRIIGSALRQLRARNKVTQAMLAETSGIDQSNISRAERGSTVPSLPVLLGSAAAIGIDKIFLRLRSSRPHAAGSRCSTRSEMP